MLIEVLKIVLICVVSLGVFLCLITLLLGYIIFKKSTNLIKNKTVKGLAKRFSVKREKSIDYINKEYSIKKIKIKSKHGSHYIPANYIYSKNNSCMNSNTVVMIHGLGGNRYSNYPIAEIFLKLGYNVLTYDQRNCNENKAKYTTFGYLEKYDAMDYINYIKSLAPNKMIGLWGTSFGGATASLTAINDKVKDKIDFIILDCPVSSMKWIVNNKLKKLKPKFLVKLLIDVSEIFLKIFLKFEYNDVEIEYKANEINQPTLIINSKIDEVTPNFMAKRIFNRIDCNKKILYTSKDSFHAEIFFDYRQIYERKVKELLELIKK